MALARGQQALGIVDQELEGTGFGAHQVSRMGLQKVETGCQTLQEK